MNETDELPPPPHEEFWQAYNSRLEFPISWLVAVLLHGLLAVGLLGVLLIASRGPDKEPVPIRLTEGGEDEQGDGNAQAAGVAEPITKGDSSGPTVADFQSLALPNTLPEVQKEVQQIIDADVDVANITVSQEKAPGYAALAEAIQKKLLPVGQKQGKGGKEDGPAGVGADATKARSLRWVMRFDTRGGRDYLDQLQSFGAVVIVPVPPDNNSAYVFHDLANPKPGAMVGEDEWKRLASQMQFCDYKQDSVRDVTAELGLARLKAQMFWAFFPKPVEDQMAQLERSHQNRPPESIEETVFKVEMVNGRHALRVVRQKLK